MLFVVYNLLDDRIVDLVECLFLFLLVSHSS